MRKIYSSIDIGSSFIKIVVLEELDKKLNILANISYPSKGIKEGMIVDLNSAVSSLKEALAEINKSLGVKIDKAITSVPIEQARYTVTEGYTTITSDDNIVTSEDILNSLQASIYNKIDDKEELVTVMPIKYIIDDHAEVKNPRGIHANKLGVLSMMITAPKSNIYKQVSLLSHAGVEVVDILFNSIGDYYALKEDSYDKENVAVINVGSDKTEVSTFTNGILRSSNIIYMGSNMIEEDLSYAYNISLDKASNLKNMFIMFDKTLASQNEIYETKDKSNFKVKINQYEASDIASNKLKEILEKSKKEINYLTKKEIRYIIITGGIVNVPGFYEIAKDVFGDIVVSKDFDVIGIRNYVYTSSFGMIKYFIEKLKLRGREYTMFNEDKEYKLVEERKNNKGFSFSKFFGYFFEKED
jgi:cell division protein FtsA